MGFEKYAFTVYIYILKVKIDHFKVSVTIPVTVTAICPYMKQRPIPDTHS